MINLLGEITSFDSKRYAMETLRVHGFPCASHNYL